MKLVTCATGRTARLAMIGRIVRLAMIVGAVLGFSVAPVHAQNALGFFKNYFVTGDYVAAGVALRGTGGSGVIDLTGAAVPEGADIVGAFLYWQTVLKMQDGVNAGTVGAMFNGQSLDSADGDVAYESIAKPVNPNGTAACWSSGGATGASQGTHKMITYRADVLRFLQDPDDPGKIDVNRTFELQLPEPGSTGNLTPSTSGAFLVLIYRDPAMPLRAVVLYDGGFTLDHSTSRMTQTIEGFYQAAMTPAARMTHAVGDGQENFGERMLFNGVPVGGTDPFAGPAWDTVTVAGLNPGIGSTAAVVVEPVTSSFDCLSWSAIVFSTAVQDTDEDGLLDVWESSTTPLRDPNARCPAPSTAATCFLPNLKAMGADPAIQDIFVEFGFMTTLGYSNEVETVSAHSHLPLKAALDRVATAFHNARTVPRPRRFGGGTITGPIRIHFDVGNNYQASLPSLASCANANTWQPNCAIIPAALARGGDAIDEAVGCVTDAGGTTCGDGDETFRNYPGTVGWKSGFNLLKNQPLHRLNSLGAPVAFETLTTSPSLESQCLTAAFNCVRRFDRNRKDIFRYALFAHALGLVRVDADGDPVRDTTGALQPKNTSGIADGGGVGGGDLMVTLGLWDNFIGSEFIQASTLAHELGHTFGLRHGGGGPVLVADQMVVQPNCKSNYLSIMNYLFQVRGLVTSSGTPTVDFSRQDLGVLNEGALNENLQSGWSSMAYRTSWFVPLVNDELEGLLASVTRRCDGTLLPDGAPLLVRVDGANQTGLIDWNWDGDTADAALVQDINFNSATNNGTITGDNANPTLAGYNDFQRMDLRQVASRRNGGSERIGGGLSLDVGFGDVGFGDVGFGDVGFGDVGFGDVGFGDVGFGDVGFGDVGFGDVGFGDVGFGDVGFGDVGAPPGELDLDAANGLNGPTSLTATALSNRIQLRWGAPPIGTAESYTVYRVVGTTITATSDITTVGPLTPTTTGDVRTVDDRDVRNNVTYTYFVVARLTAGGILTGPSNFVTIRK